MRRATLREVSELAEVSVATASMVLSGKTEGRFTDETAQRVRQAAHQLGYRANRLARGLRSQSTKVLGMLSFSVATTEFAGQMLKGAQAEARARGYELLLLEVDLDPESIADGLEIMSDHQVDGVLVASFFHVGIRLPQRVPANLVMVDSYATNRDVDAFFPDEFNSMTQAVELIGKAGHKRVGYIADGRDFPAVHGRLAAVEAAAAEYGWDDLAARTVTTGDTEAIDGYTAALDLLTRHPDTTALVAYNDRLAMGVFQAAAELGRQIPNDLSVVGFDNHTVISAALRPGLTTVALPHLEMGRLAVARLIERCEAEEELAPQQVAVPGDLVVRGSVAAAAAVATGSNTRKP